jgi:hypothetical protein
MTPEEKRILSQFNQERQARIQSDPDYQKAVQNQDWKAAKTIAETLGLQ